MKISQRLVLGFAGVLFFVFVTGIVGWFGVTKVSQEVGVMYTSNTKPLPHLGSVSGLFQRIRVNVRDLFLDPNISDRKKYVNTIGELQKEIGEHMEEVKKSLHSEDAKADFANIEKELAAFGAFGNQIAEYALAGNDKAGIEKMNRECRANAKKVEAAIEKLDDLKIKQAEAMFKDAEKISKNLVIAMIIITLASVAISVAIGFFIARSIRNPIIKMRDMINDIAEGEGDLTKRLDASANDEIGEVSKGFNKFVEKLHDIISQVSNTTNEVATASEQLHSTAEAMANGAERVAGQVGTVATAGEEMSATSSEIAQNCQMAADGSQQATSAAMSGAKVVEETIAVMQNIADRVNSSAKTVEALGQRSDQIGEIVRTIEDIADQTNLLALNAAIEAARAGEQGRGFAVVADEVRALAERTTKATKEISDMIKAIQNETKTAVNSMVEGVNEVSTGSQKAASSGQALERILEQVNAVTAQIHQVATAAEQQTVTTSEISSNMQQITEVIAQTAHGASSSSEEANRLSGLAGKLSKIVGQFKL